MICLFVGFFCFGSSSFIKADASVHGFRDSLGRQRVFHGVNAVYKIPPWAPSQGQWNAYDSLVEKDFQDLSSWGFNFIRLGVMWPGVNPTNATFFNSTYLAQMESIINAAGKYGIVTLVDLHQDLLSSYFCGEGAPDWAIKPPSGIAEFPLPVKLPYKLDSNGKPLPKECEQLTFSDYYVSEAVSGAFQALYENENGLMDAYLRFWDFVSKTFAQNTNVIGYELINEPFFGDIFKNPKLLESGVTDREYLLPMYDKATKVIRQNDASHIIFFEPSVADETHSGFDFSPANDTNACYSYHCYCPKTPTGDGLKEDLCHVALDWELKMKMDDAKRINNGVCSMMTEFGAVDNSIYSSERMDFQTNQMDSNGAQSWSYWQYKPFYDITTTGGDAESFYFFNGTLQAVKVKTLARTYAEAVQGALSSTSFDMKSGDFSLVYTADISIQAPTQIYVSSFYYPTGYNVTITPPSAATWKRSPTSPHRILVNAAKVGQIELRISPDVSGRSRISKLN